MDRRRPGWPGSSVRRRRRSGRLGRLPDNPFLADLDASASLNPFAVGRGTGHNPFADDDDEPAVPNPFAPTSARRPAVEPDAPRKLQLLARGIGVIGSYAKVLERDDVPAAYCQFGPLTAYPRAQQTRDLYPRLPSAPLPAVITCIATTPEARGEGLGLRLVQAVCEDLASRGFAAVEAYPEVAARGRTRRVPRPRRSGLPPDSRLRSTTSGSRSCAES